MRLRARGPGGGAQPGELARPRKEALPEGLASPQGGARPAARAYNKAIEDAGLKGKKNVNPVDANGQPIPKPGY